MANFYASYPFEAGGGGGGGSPTGPAGGDLSGTYPDPTVPLLHQDPNTFAGFDGSGNLGEVPGWIFDIDGQVQGFLTGTPADDTLLLHLGATVSTPLTGGAEGVIVSYDFSSTLEFSSSYNVENTYDTGFVNSGGIGQFQDQSNFSAGAISGNYTSFAAFPTIAGTTTYTGVDISPTLTSTTSGDSGLSFGMNLNSGYTNSGGFININDANNLNTGASVQNYVSYNADPILDGTVSSIYQGVSINPQGTTPPTVGMTAFDADFSHWTTLPYLPMALNSDGGIIEQSATLNTQFITPDATYGINQIGGTLEVAAGFPINAGQFGFGNNIGVSLEANDNIGVDSSGADIGFSSVGFVAELSIASGKTVATLNMMAAGAGIASGSGNITNASLFRALGFLPEGGTLDITNFYGFKADALMAAIGATNTWAFYDGAGSENFVSKLAIGTSTQKVANGSTALEIGNQKAFLPGRVTTVQKLALTAIAGMQVYDTTLNQMSYYNGTTWVNF